MLFVLKRFAVAGVDGGNLFGALVEVELSGACEKPIRAVTEITKAQKILNKAGNLTGYDWPR
jgi:hypothetical protein